MCVGFLHYPSLDQFPFLPGIAAVYNLVGFGYQAFDYFELSFIAFDRDEFYPEFRG